MGRGRECASSRYQSIVCSAMIGHACTRRPTCARAVHGACRTPSTCVVRPRSSLASSRSPPTAKGHQRSDLSISLIRPRVLLSTARVLSDGGTEVRLWRKGGKTCASVFLQSSRAFLLAAPTSAAPGALAQQAAAMKYCKADYERLRPGVQPGGGRIIGCLKAHKEKRHRLRQGAARAMKAKMGR